MLAEALAGKVGRFVSVGGYVGVRGIYSLTAEAHNGLGTDSLVMVKVEKGNWVMLKP